MYLCGYYQVKSNLVVDFVPCLMCNRSAEFIIYKLKEMGKINQEDISVLLQEFENLDVDQSGTLSTCDLKLAQSDQARP